jgi:NAD(P)-dependent dehydrogenase (short-subunit alcohol dehydrogenase family)
MDLFHDRVVLITGAGSGIGKALAFYLAAKGAKVVLNGRSIDKLHQTEKELQDRGYQNIALAPGDVSIYGDCEKIIQAAINAFGRLDVLVNNAGLTMEGEIENLHPDVFKAVMEVNYLGSLYPSKAALPWLKQSQGSIVFISSVAGIYGLPRHSGYSASKMALTALAQALRIELNGTGVHVGIIYIGFVENDAGKTQYVTSGQLEAMPNRQNARRISTAAAARFIAKVIAQRKKSSNYSFLGRLLLAVEAFSPYLVRIILTRTYKKRS